MADMHDAVSFATMAHSGQNRKGTLIPYLVHPLGAATILLEAGCSEDLGMAAVLHDTMENAGVSVQALSRRFGERVAQMVEMASEPDKTDTWEERKRHTIEVLWDAPAGALLVSLADKLDNVRSIQRAFLRNGDDVWKRFNRPRVFQRWYYTSLARIFEERLTDGPGGRLAGEFQQEVSSLFPVRHAAANEPSAPQGAAGILSWDDVRSLAAGVFNIGIHRPELFWAEVVWGGLTGAGLTEYRDEEGRVQVVARLLALGTFFYDWCHLVWDDSYEDACIWSAAADAEIDPVAVRRARDRVKGEPAGERPSRDAPDEEVLAELVYHERGSMVRGLLECFGGPTELFVSLNMSMFVPSDGHDLAPEEQYEAVRKEVLTVFTGRKMDAWNWLSQGCEPLVSPREPMDPDDDMDDE